MSQFEFSREYSETVYPTVYYSVKAETKEEALELLKNAPFRYETIQIEDNNVDFKWENDFELLSEKNEED